MSNIKSSKNTFCTKVSSNIKNKPSQSTQRIVSQDGISIKVFRVSSTKTIGNTKVDFESKRRKDFYKKLNKMLGEG